MIAGAVSAATLGPSVAVSQSETPIVMPHLAGTGAPDDEAFWGAVRKCFDLDPAVTMLNNGGVSPASRMVMDALKRTLDACNRGPSNVMWRHYEPMIEDVRKRVAAYFGCDHEEIALVRNASEANQTFIMGLDLKSGDEVLTTQFDYPRMVTAIDQRVRREGVVMRQVAIPPVPKTEAELLDPLVEAMTDRVKMIVVSHVCFVNGLILPVAKIAHEAAKRGIPILVDGAHAMGQFPFLLKDVNAFAYGGTLHKWLLGPIGTGYLHVKREHIGKLWSLQPSDATLAKDIRKFEQFGTHPAAIHNAIHEAIEFHALIGRDRIANRLQYLRLRWANVIKDLPGVKFGSSLDPHFSRGLTTVKVGSATPGELGAWLLEKHRLFVTTIDMPAVQGIRVSPSVYTSVEEVDRLAAALTEAALKGIR